MMKKACAIADADERGHIRSRVAAGIRRACLTLLSVVIVACDGLPRDPEGTIDRIRTRGEIRIGVPESAAGGTVFDDPIRKFVARLEQRTGAQGRIETADAEALLRRVRVGDLDVVIGRFDDDSPWRRHVVFATPVDRRGSRAHEPPYRAVTMNGENAWAGIVEIASYRLARKRR